MKAIVAVDLNWGIGYKGSLLQRIPEDMKRFRKLTLGKVVIMGRETFKSLPGKEPLKDRINIVLSKSGNVENDNIVLCRSLDELFCELEKYDTDDVFVIGGESIYSQLLPFCDELYVTRIENSYIADKYFPDLDKVGVWKSVSDSEQFEYEGLKFRYAIYEKV